VATVGDGLRYGLLLGGLGDQFEGVYCGGVRGWRHTARYCAVAYFTASHNAWCGRRAGRWPGGAAAQWLGLHVVAAGALPASASQVHAGAVVTCWCSGSYRKVLEE
jgi:hypothetical protein